MSVKPPIARVPSTHTGRTGVCRAAGLSRQGSGISEPAISRKSNHRSCQGAHQPIRPYTDSQACAGVNHTYEHNHRDFHPHSPLPPIPDASQAYMARPRASPSMKHRRRAEGDLRERNPHRPWDRGRDRSPGRRLYSPDPASKQDHSTLDRERDRGNWDKRPPHRNSHPHRRSKKPYPARPSYSPPRSSKPKNNHPPRQKQFDHPSHRPRDYSVDRQTKRRRTRSPSAADSERGRLGYDQYKRDRPGVEDTKRNSVSPRKERDHHSSRPRSSSRATNNEPFVHPDRRRDFTPPPVRRRDRRSRSPGRSSQASPDPRVDSHPSSIHSRESSIVSNRPEHHSEKSGKGRFGAKKAKQRARPASKTPSLVDDTDTRSMDGQYPPRGGYGHRGQQRSYVDTRQHQQPAGSPPFPSTPNSSYRGSPQANSPYHNQRGGWGRGRGHHGYVSLEPSRFDCC